MQLGILILLSIIALCCVVFLVAILKIRHYMIHSVLPYLQSKEYLLNYLDREKGVNSLSIKEAMKKKARIDYIIEIYMEKFAIILANKMSLALGFRKKSSTNE